MEAVAKLSVQIIVCPRAAALGKEVNILAELLLVGIYPVEWACASGESLSAIFRLGHDSVGDPE